MTASVIMTLTKGHHGLIIIQRMLELKRFGPNLNLLADKYCTCLPCQKYNDLVRIYDTQNFGQPQQRPVTTVTQSNPTAMVLSNSNHGYQDLSHLINSGTDEPNRPVAHPRNFQNRINNDPADRLANRPTAPAIISEGFDDKPTYANL